MSMKERRRLAALEQVQAKQLTLRAAAERLGLSERQAKRVYARFKAEGDAGLVHRLRGRAGNRLSDPAVRQRALELYQTHYGDFGPTLAAEYLAAEHELTVKPGTLRRWLVAAGLWRRRRRRPVRRRRRERRRCFGELVQLDGSPHDWFEGRGERCVAMVMVDDATSWTHVHFAEAETTHAAMTIFDEWAREHGAPGRVYPDRHSIYRVNTAAADEVEHRTGKRPRTQFGRAMDELGVGLSCANSPQAKGRVERTNGTLQDRLIKAMRLAGVSDVERANEFVARQFLPGYNARFARAPADPADAHLRVGEAQLEAALCTREDRKVGSDQCISWKNRVLQLTPGRRTPPLAGKRVRVNQKLDGTLEVRYGQATIEHTALAQRPEPAAPEKPSLAERVAEHAPQWKPPADHPWRQESLAG